MEGNTESSSHPACCPFCENDLSICPITRKFCFTSRECPDLGSAVRLVSTERRLNPASACPFRGFEWRSLSEQVTCGSIPKPDIVTLPATPLSSARPRLLGVSAAREQLANAGSRLHSSVYNRIAGEPLRTGERLGKPREARHTETPENTIYPDTNQDTGKYEHPGRELSGTQQRSPQTTGTEKPRSPHQTDLTTPNRPVSHGPVRGRQAKGLTSPHHPRRAAPAPHTFYPKGKTP